VSVADSARGILQLIESARVAQGHQRTHKLFGSDDLYTAFRQKLQSDNCVFVGYDGELLPW
jgi:hypothetical protein